MPGDPIECRIRANRCAEIAAETDNPDLKQKLLDLAEQWLKIAGDIEAIQTLRGWPPSTTA
jgi:hypothetical protein